MHSPAPTRKLAKRCRQEAAALEPKKGSRSSHLSLPGDSKRSYKADAAADDAVGRDDDRDHRATSRASGLADLDVAALRGLLSGSQFVPDVQDAGRDVVNAFSLSPLRAPTEGYSGEGEDCASPVSGRGESKRAVMRDTSRMTTSPDNMATVRKGKSAG